MHVFSNSESQPHRLGRLLVFAMAAAPFWLSSVAAAAPAHHNHPTNSLVSMAQNGSPAVDGAESTTPQAVSANGRYVVFSTLSDLDAKDTDANFDVYLRDTVAKTTTLVSVTADGTQAAGGSVRPSISANGRYVAFYSYADTIVPDDTNGFGDVFVTDLLTHHTTRASVSSNGEQDDGANSLDNAPQLSADGRYVAFESFATNLVPNDNNGRQDVFVRDQLTGTTSRVSVSSHGVEGNDLGDGSRGAAISADGRYVAFASGSTNLVPNDTNNAADVFVRDRLLGTTSRVSVATNGTQSTAENVRPTISADGRYVAYEGWGTGLVPNDTNNAPDVFLRDRWAHTTTRVSVTQNGTQGNDQSIFAALSADGRYVAFQSRATTLDSQGSGDTNGDFDVFVKDLQTGKISREDVTPQGALSNGYAAQPSLSANGRYITLVGTNDLVAGLNINLPEVFVRQRF